MLIIKIKLGKDDQMDYVALCLGAHQCFLGFSTTLLGYTSLHQLRDTNPEVILDTVNLVSQSFGNL